MLARNVTPLDLECALAKVNEKFGGNIVLRNMRLAPRGRGIRFTLGVISSRGPGSRLSVPHYTWSAEQVDKQRHISAACWHVHGHFFDALPEGAVIIARGRKIRPGDEWEDTNIGSRAFPFYYSDACEC